MKQFELKKVSFAFVMVLLATVGQAADGERVVRLPATNSADSVSAILWEGMAKHHQLETQQTIFPTKNGGYMTKSGLLTIQCEEKSTRGGQSYECAFTMMAITFGNNAVAPTSTILPPTTNADSLEAVLMAVMAEHFEGTRGESKRVKKIKNGFRMSEGQIRIACQATEQAGVSPEAQAKGCTIDLR